MTATTSPICIFSKEQAVLCTLWTWEFHFCTFQREVTRFAVSCVDDVSSLNQSHQLNSTRVSRHISSQTSWSNREMIAETRSYIFSLRCRCCLRIPCSLLREWKLDNWTSVIRYYLGFSLHYLLLSLCRALWRILRAKMENLAG